MKKMKKLLSVFTLAVISSGALAGTGHGYTVLERKVEMSPGIEAYSVDVSAKKKALSQKEIMSLHKQRVSSPKQD